MNQLDNIIQDYIEKVFKIQNALIIDATKDKNLPLNPEDYNLMITDNIKHLWYKPNTEEAQLVITLYPLETNTIFNERSSRRSQPIVYASAEGHRQFQEALQEVVEDLTIPRTPGEMFTGTAEEMWIDLRNEIPIPRIDLSVMTEQEIINHFDTISNE